jgi:hypothetical protein
MTAWSHDDTRMKSLVRTAAATLLTMVWMSLSAATYLVMPVRANWLVDTVVALVEEPALFGQEGLEAVSPYYGPGSCAEFWSAEVKIFEIRQYGSEACVV